MRGDAGPARRPRLRIGVLDGVAQRWQGGGAWRIEIEVDGERHGASGALAPVTETGPHSHSTGALRGLPAEGVGRDFGSAAGESFPLP